MTIKAILLIAAATALSACASDPAQTTASNADVVCSRETPVGSHFPVTKCRTPEQVAQEKAAAESATADIRRTTGTRPSE